MQQNDRGIYLITITFHHVYDVLTLNNPKFNDYIDVIYPQKLEIKDTSYAPKWANHLDLRLEFDDDSKLFTRLYDKRDDFPIVNCPCLQYKSRLSS